MRKNSCGKPARCSNACRLVRRLPIASKSPCSSLHAQPSSHQDTLDNLDEQEIGQRRSRKEEEVQAGHRPNEDHEIADELDIPALRFLFEGGVHVVCRNRHLGQVAEEVVEQNLCWEQGIISKSSPFIN
jgi:hypothetical protein